MWKSYIWNQHNSQLPVGLLAQLVERCTGITEVMRSNPVEAWIFSRPYFHYCSSSVRYCEDRFHNHGDDIVRINNVYEWDSHKHVLNISVNIFEEPKSSIQDPWRTGSYLTPDLG